MKSENSRKQKIIEILYNQIEYKTANELAEELDVSSKTIYRTIKELNNEHIIIDSQPGKGFKLNHKEYSKIVNQLEYSQDYLLPKIRQDDILEEILIDSPTSISIDDLYCGYYVSESVINQDIQSMRSYLNKFNIKLKRYNNMLSTVGEEGAVRRAIVDLIQNRFQNDSPEQYIKDKLNEDDYRFINQQVEYIENILQNKIPYPHDINFFVHLYVLIKRIKNNDSEKISDNKLNNINVNKNSTHYYLAIEVYKNLCNYLKKQIPDFEINNIYQHLCSFRIEQPKRMEEYTKETRQVTDYYVTRMQEILNLKISNEIYNSLAGHIQPMLSRLKNSIKIKNGMLEDIKREYKKLFDSVRLVSNEVAKKFSLSEINDDEVAFISLYFAIEKEKKFKKMQILIVCTTGIGTAQLLKTKISIQFPNLEIVNVTSASNIENELKNNPDIELIVSTVIPPKEYNIPTVVVSVLFTNEDAMLLDNAIKRLKR